MKPEPRYKTDQFFFYHPDDIAGFLQFWEKFINQPNRFRYGSTMPERLEKYMMEAEELPPEALGMVMIYRHDFYAQVIDFMDMYYEVGEEAFRAGIEFYTES